MEQKVSTHQGRRSKKVKIQTKIIKFCKTWKVHTFLRKIDLDTFKNSDILCINIIINRILDWVFQALYWWWFHWGLQCIWGLKKEILLVTDQRLSSCWCHDKDFKWWFIWAGLVNWDNEFTQLTSSFIELALLFDY